MPIMEITDLPADLAGRSDAQRLLDASISLAESFCKRSFAFATVTETHDGGNAHELWLKRCPVNSIDSVYANDYELTDYSFDAETGRLWRGAGYGHRRLSPLFPYGTENIAVTYSGGYVDAPDDLVFAISEGVRGLVREESRDGTLQSESFAGHYSWTAADGVSADQFSAFSGSAKTILRKYRRSGRFMIG